MMIAENKVAAPAARNMPKRKAAQNKNGIGA